MDNQTIKEGIDEFLNFKYKKFEEIYNNFSDKKIDNIVKFTNHIKNNFLTDFQNKYKNFLSLFFNNKLPDKLNDILDEYYKECIGYLTQYNSIENVFNIRKDALLKISNILKQELNIIFEFIEEDKKKVQEYDDEIRNLLIKGREEKKIQDAMQQQAMQQQMIQRQQAMQQQAMRQQVMQQQMMQQRRPPPAPNLLQSKYDKTMQQKSVLFQDEASVPKNIFSKKKYFKTDKPYNKQKNFRFIPYINYNDDDVNINIINYNILEDNYELNSGTFVYNIKEKMLFNLEDKVYSISLKNSEITSIKYFLKSMITGEYLEIIINIPLIILSYNNNTINLISDLNKISLENGVSFDLNIYISELIKIITKYVQKLHIEEYLY